MAVTSLRTIVALNLLLTVAGSDGIALNERHLWRRQSETEKESTTTTQSNPNSNVPKGQQPGFQQSPTRLFPDISSTGFMPIQPVQVGPANTVGYQLPPIGLSTYPQQPTPFLPFGPQTTPVGFQVQPKLPASRQVSPAERQQSLTFTNGLGKRLLSMIGIEVGPTEPDPKESRINQDEQQGGVPKDPISPVQDAIKALQNSSILVKLNSGVQSIYGGLSKMYNDTVHDQIRILQERFQRQSENSTNPWQQRIAQQVPMFFKNMASRIESAQEHLNQLWQQVGKANNNSLPQMTTGQPQARSSFLDQLVPPGFFNDPFGTIDRQDFGQDAANIGQEQQQDLGARLMQFWHQQVQPQVGALRSQMSRVWRDLASSGVFQPQVVTRNQPGNILGSPNNNNNKEQQTGSSSDLVENILKEVDINNSEYTLVNPSNQESGKQNDKTDSPNQSNSEKKPFQGSLAIQNGLMNAQRELNQLWMGLSNSVQSAMNNVRRNMGPRQPFGAPMSSSSSGSAGSIQDSDPASNEIETKIRNLGELQKEADTVHDVVKQQQMRPQVSFGDRFRNFFNDVNLSRVEEFPRRVGESVNRFGTVLGDLWNQIPERWDNFMQAHRPTNGNQDMFFNRNQMASSRSNTGSTTSTTTTTTQSSASQ